MKKLVPILIALILGILIGWALGFTRPRLKAELEFCRNVNINPSELRSLIQTNKAIAAYIDEDNSRTALLALYTLLKLHAGDIEAAKARAVEKLVQYHHDYGPSDKANIKQSDTQRAILEKIERAGQSIPELKRAMGNP